MTDNFPQAIYHFQLDAAVIFSQPFGAGHINQTSLIVTESAREYILQKINQAVFRDPPAVMKNIRLVTDHLRQQSPDRPREVLTIVPSIAGQDWYKDEAGDFWRVYEFVSDSICLQQPRDDQDFYNSGWAFGHFQKQLAKFDAALLSETIPYFHDTPCRYMALHQALQADRQGRAAQVGPELDFALSREAGAGLLQQLQAQGTLPLKVTHNDTKLNNVLLDRWTRNALCVIDLDTVMPGLLVHDFGDSIRFGASTAAEDERDLTQVTLSLARYQTYLQGFSTGCAEGMSAEERYYLRDGARLMTLECGVRFLTDYLNGDVYFHTSRPGQNLDRCRTQFKLVRELEAHWSELEQLAAR
ncbi:MAG: aminoglycoside phosphotransferase family protein [Oscillospiraceae bacterium]|nr:aminoglycoside phosphotransferase family protein [Oscillospiraceae bacterium]MDD4367590.1 aminoglycoside phosphotransferase family protein [Oscillospiraceae bacterium]